MFLRGSDIPARLGTHHSQHVFQLAGHLQVDRRCGGMKSATHGGDEELNQWNSEFAWGGDPFKFL